jgi:hypothetical protein
VEGTAPSETEKERVHGVRAGNVGAPVTPWVIAPTVVCLREKTDFAWLCGRESEK